MRKILILFLAIFFLTFCKPTSIPDKEQILEADRKFSATAAEKGYNLAFIEFAHSEAVLLRENSMPVIGMEAIKKLYEKADTSGIHFIWEPLSGDIASSGELGYTYGVYSFTKDSVTEKGTYISVWKKDAAGNWKYVLDSGNKGIGEESNNSK